MRAAALATTSGSSGSTALLGVIGMPWVAISARASVLWPSRRIQRDDGPMKHSPAASTRSAKLAFSDRKP